MSALPARDAQLALGQARLFAYEAGPRLEHAPIVLRSTDRRPDMTRPCIFALGLTLGALVSPAAQILAARYCDRHVLTN